MAATTIYNDQCMYTFDTPYSPGGLYVNMATFHGVGERFLELDHEKSKAEMYLHLQWKKVKKPEEEKKEVTKVAIGVEGGFDAPQYDIEKVHAIVKMPGKVSTPYPSADLPEGVTKVAEAILAHEGSARKAQVGWEEEAYQESIFAKELVQVPTDKKVSSDPKTWIDMETGEQSDNLWLNLSDGYIGGGRRQMTADGQWVGSGSALKHFEETGRKYPLAVKLSTISSRGADIYSYAEDDMVLDPYLEQHLAHFGIVMNKMEKTGKSMAEMNVDMNLKFEYSRILEGGKELVPKSGAGYIGIENLGATCYINSVVQCLFAIPEFQKRYVEPSKDIFRSAPEDLPNDFPTQMARLGSALLEDTYKESVEEDPNQVYIEPFTFKNLVGKGHSEFSSDRQQDAAEYLQHLLEYISRTDRQHATRLQSGVQCPDLFRFEMEIRTQCNTSKKVRYSASKHNMLELPVPMEAATNKEEFDEYRAKRQKLSESKSGEEEKPVLASVPFEACLQKLVSEETIRDFYSSATKTKGEATKTVSAKSFPKYLVVQLRKYYIDTDFSAKKMEVEIDNIPDVLDLEWMRGSGMKPGEEPMPEESAAGSQASGPVPDPAVVAMVVSMGFSENAGKRAALATGNADAEQAVNWVLGHMDDADLNDPLPLPGATDAAVAINPEHVATLGAMGFAPKPCECALKACDGNIERAVEWLFSHADDLDAACAAMDASKAAEEKEKGSPNDDGKGVFELMGFITHLGKNTMCGHYVCHLKKDGEWVLFNDRKVGITEKSSRGLAYLYLYKRKDA